jgi:hypothetical protein
MAITVKDFPALTDDLQSIFNEVAKTKVAEIKGNKIFNVFDTKRRSFDHLVLHGLEGIQEVTPGQDLPNISGVEGKIIALFKSKLINGENLRRKAMVTLTKLIEKTKNSILQVQRLSVWTPFGEATV